VGVLDVDGDDLPGTTGADAEPSAAELLTVICDPVDVL
jgi:hypothetical protein